MGTSDNSEPIATSKHESSSHRWTKKLYLTNVVLIAAAVIAAYLEYVAYRQDMVSELETNIVLKLSFLTYHYDSIRGSEHIVGLPAFDFFQAFVYLAIIINAWYFMKARRRA